MQLKISWYMVFVYEKLKLLDFLDLIVGMKLGKGPDISRNILVTSSHYQTSYHNVLCCTC